eukprot:evm.model.scf_60.15 EVM.evm.TU.scf_60.15   scf_60:121914-123182(+)
MLRPRGVPRRARPTSARRRGQAGGGEAIFFLYTRLLEVVENLEANGPAPRLANGSSKPRGPPAQERKASRRKAPAFDLVGSMRSRVALLQKQPIFKIGHRWSSAAKLAGKRRELWKRAGGLWFVVPQPRNGEPAPPGCVVKAHRPRDRQAKRGVLDGHAGRLFSPTKALEPREDSGDREDPVAASAEEGEGGSGRITGCARCLTIDQVRRLGRRKPPPRLPALSEEPLRGRGSDWCRPRGSKGLHQALQDALEDIRRDKFVVRRSAIDTLGVYATEAIAEGMVLMEYTGEMVRRTVADLREREYMARGLGCYFFGVGRDYVVDATAMGGIARYVNHSCDPNCYTKLQYPARNHTRGSVSLEDQHRRMVVLRAKRDIAPGEELTYDYKLSPAEGAPALPGQERADGVGVIRCTCNARNCRRYL